MTPTLSTPSAFLLTQAVEAMLGATPLTVFVGQVLEPETDPVTGLMRPYAAIWPGAGTAQQDRLTAHAAGLLWRAQVTVAGPDPYSALAAVDAARTALVGRRVTADGTRGGVIRETETDEPLREDRDAHPFRWWLPLQITLHATRRST